MSSSSKKRHTGSQSWPNGRRTRQRTPDTRFATGFTLRSHEHDDRNGVNGAREKDCDKQREIQRQTKIEQNLKGQKEIEQKIPFPSNAQFSSIYYAYEDDDNFLGRQNEHISTLRSSFVCVATSDTSFVVAGWW
jgi:hypothetical protein